MTTTLACCLLRDDADSSDSLDEVLNISMSIEVIGGGGVGFSWADSGALI